MSDHYVGALFLLLPRLAFAVIYGNIHFATQRKPCFKKYREENENNLSQLYCHEHFKDDEAKVCSYREGAGSCSGREHARELHEKHEPAEEDGVHAACVRLAAKLWVRLTPIYGNIFLVSAAVSVPINDAVLYPRHPSSLPQQTPPPSHGHLSSIPRPTLKTRCDTRSTVRSTSITHLCATFKSGWRSVGFVSG